MTCKLQIHFLCMCLSCVRKNKQKKDLVRKCTWNFILSFSVDTPTASACVSLCKGEKDKPGDRALTPHVCTPDNTSKSRVIMSLSLKCLFLSPWNRHRQTQSWFLLIVFDAVMLATTVPTSKWLSKKVNRKLRDDSWENYWTELIPQFDIMSSNLVTWIESRMMCFSSVFHTLKFSLGLFDGVNVFGFKFQYTTNT